MGDGTGVGRGTPPTGTAGEAGWVVAVWLLYAAAAAVSVQLRLGPEPVQAITLNAGVAAAALVGSSWRLVGLLLPGFAAATFVVLLADGVSPAAAGWAAVGNVCASLVIAAVLRLTGIAWVTPRASADWVVRFTLATLLAALTASATTVLGLALTTGWDSFADPAGDVSVGSVGSVLLARITSRVLGTAVVAPALVVVHERLRARRSPPAEPVPAPVRPHAQLAAWAAVLGVTVWLAIFADGTTGVLPYLPLTVLLVAVLRHGAAAATVLTPVLVMATLASTIASPGPFLVSPEPFEQLFAGQLYCLLAVITAWWVAVVVGERTAALRRLEADEQRLRGEVARRGSALDRLERLTATLAGSLSVEAQIDVLATRVVDLLDVDACRVYAVEPGGVPRLVSTAGDAVLDAGPVAQDVVRSGTAVVLRRDPWSAGVPMTADGAVVGVLCVAGTGARRPQADGDVLAALQRVAERLAVRVRQRQLAEAVRTERDLGHRRVATALDELIDAVALAHPVRPPDGGAPQDFVTHYANGLARSWGVHVGDSVLPPRNGPDRDLLADYRAVVGGGGPLVLDSLELPVAPDRDGTRFVDLRAVRQGEDLLITWRDVTDRVLAEQALARSEERFRDALAGMLDPVLIARPVRDPVGEVVDFVVEYLNRGAAEAVPVGARVRRAAPPWGGEPSFRLWRRVLLTGDPLVLDEVELRDFPRHDGTRGTAWVDLRVVSIGGEVLASWRDVTDRVRAARALAEAEQRFRLVFDEAPVPVVVTAIGGPDDGRFVLANEAMTELTGWSAAELPGMELAQLTDPDDAVVDAEHFALLRAGSDERFQRETRVVRRDGSALWVRRTMAAVHVDGRPAYAVAHLEDVTERKAAQDELSRRALYDPLTGLANRDLLLDHLRSELAALSRQPGTLAVVFLDLDRFKDVNDTLGHHVGDDTLRQVAARITGCLRPTDTASRLAGDEFVVVARVDDALGAARIAERLHAAIGAPVVVGGRVVHVPPSIGVATTGDPEAGPEELLRQADLAMYQAKRHGSRPWELYDEALHERALQRIAVEEHLGSALEEGWLRLVYQPIVDLDAGRVVGAEALLRIEHPREGLLMPASFIEVAEDSNLIVPIGRWVLEEACRALAGWQRLDARMQVSVNVSGRQARHLVVTEHVVSAAADAGVEPSGLVLEITERVLVDGGDDVMADLRRATELGCGLAIDDFGTGYSSLTYLTRFPVTTVKIDRGFVEGIEVDGADRAIVHAVTSLASTLSLTAVAEGVESASQLSVLRGLGCHRAQGYHLGRPTSVAAIGDLLADGRPVASPR